MIEMNECILHVLDTEKNICVFAEELIPEMEPEIEKLLQNKIQKAFTSNNIQHGYFKANSSIKQGIDDYLAKECSFVELSRLIGEIIFEKKMKYGLFQPCDFICCNVLIEGRRFIALLDNSYNEGITHNVRQEEDRIVNEIIRHKTLFSTNIMKRDAVVLIETSDMSIQVVENKSEIEAEKIYFYTRLVLDCDSSPSYQESSKVLQKKCETMINKYELDEVAILPKMKQLIKESLDSNVEIDIQEMAVELFPERRMIQDDFKQEVLEQGIKPKIQVENVKQTKQMKVQRFKTDSGIEVIIPIECMSQKELVEIINNPDGTIAIQLKNINKIQSK